MNEKQLVNFLEEHEGFGHHPIYFIDKVIQVWLEKILKTSLDDQFTFICLFSGRQEAIDELTEAILEEQSEALFRIKENGLRRALVQSYFTEKLPSIPVLGRYPSKWLRELLANHVEWTIRDEAAKVRLTDKGAVRFMVMALGLEETEKNLQHEFLMSNKQQSRTVKKKAVKKKAVKNLTVRVAKRKLTKRSKR